MNIWDVIFKVATIVWCAILSWLVFKMQATQCNLQEERSKESQEHIKKFDKLGDTESEMMSDRVTRLEQMYWSTRNLIDALYNEMSDLPERVYELEQMYIIDEDETEEQK